MPADSTDLEQVTSFSPVRYQINTEPLELLGLQPSEPIASESADMFQIEISNFTVPKDIPLGTEFYH